MSRHVTDGNREAARSRRPDPAVPPASPCPRCGRPLRLARNPYYGVSLAVHEWLWICDSCVCARFAAPTDDGFAVEDPAPSTDPGFLRLGRLIREMRRARRGSAG